MSSYLFGEDIDPEHIARRLKADFLVDEEKQINFEELLTNLNIRIVSREIKPGVLGACKSKGLKRLIVINPDINNEGRKRFTIAHELGHLVLHHGIQYCRERDLNLFFTKNDIERQANLFASEILLPKFNLKKILHKNEITFDLIIDISKKYNASLIATAIRLVSLCDDPVALFYHEKGKIKWTVSSLECMYNVEKYFAHSLPIIDKCNKENIVAKGYVDISNWFDTNDDIKCFEETMYFSNLGSYLTIAKIEDYEY